MHLRWFLALLVLLGQPAEAQGEKRIALSFDDVPRARGPFFTPNERARRLLRQLRSARAPQAVFFVVPGQLADDDGKGGERRIANYVRAGNVIANHSFSHRHLSEMTAEAYLADIDAADRWLRGRPGFRPWFRFPFLDEGGRDKARRDALRAGLAARDLRNGYVTAESSDWNLENLTAEAVRAGKRVDRKALGELYVTWHVEAAEFADVLMQKVIGRQPVHVLLLHETDLAALYLGDLVRALREAGWTVVSADEAYADPLGRLAPDTPSATGTLTEALAWERGLPAPRWYRYNNIALAARTFEDRVLHEQSKP